MEHIYWIYLTPYAINKLGGTPLAQARIATYPLNSIYIVKEYGVVTHLDIPHQGPKKILSVVNLFSCVRANMPMFS